MLNVLLRRLVEVMKADAAVLFLKEGDRLVIRASVGIEAAVAAQYSVPLGQGLAGLIAASPKPLYVADAQTDPRVENPFVKQRGIRSLLAMPLRRNGTLVGVIHADWLAPHPLREQEVHLLEIVAERCAMAILNAQLHRDLKRNEERYERLAELSPDGIVIFGTSRSSSRTRRA